MHLRALLGIWAMVVSLASGATVASAQESTAQHPADIRLGSCASPGEAVAPLAALTVPAGDAQGQAGATPVAQSVTDVPMFLADMLASGHALAVHASPEQVGSLVACGEIGGALTPEGTLAVGLAEMNDSKFEGVAYFAPTAAGDGTTITVLMTGGRNPRDRTANASTDETTGADVAGEADVVFDATGPSAVDGTDGADGADGTDGADGGDGMDGADGADGQPGHPGQPSQPGADGVVARGGSGGAGGEGSRGGSGGDGGNGGDGGDGAGAGRGGDGGAGGAGESVTRESSRSG